MATSTDPVTQFFDDMEGLLAGTNYLGPSVAPGEAQALVGQMEAITRLSPAGLSSTLVQDITDFETEVENKKATFTIGPNSNGRSKRATC
jgi:hypothetical protein